MSIADRLEALSIVLPEPAAAGGNYVPARRAGQLCFLSGVVSAHHGVVLTGTVGGDRTLDEGYSAARACGMVLLANLQAALGSLDQVDHIVSATGYIHVARGFKDLSGVMDGFSDLMTDVFGEAGRHTRAAIGASALPRGAMVEVQMIAAVKA